MIITDISAENFLKYQSLELRNLPEAGLIAIEGANESGKSSIGETICYALFGRTFSLDSNDLEKLIRWGEMRCSVSLRFKTDAGGHFEVARFLDRDGNHGVRLNRVGEEEPIARGADPVDNMLYELLGYSYDEFIESFYLAQREITTPHPHSDAVKTMAGLSSLEYVSYEFEQEIDEERQSVDIAEEEIASLDDELAELDIQEGRLAELEADLITLTENESSLQGEIEGLEALSTTYQDNFSKIRSARGARGRARFLRFISFVLGVASAVVWGLLERMPDQPYSVTVRDLLLQFYPQWSDDQLPMLLYAAAGLAVLFLLLWIRVATKGAVIVRLEESSAGLSGKLQKVREAMPLPMQESEEEGEASEDAEAVEEASGADQQRLGHVEFSTLCNQIAATEASPNGVRDSVGRELAWMRLELQQRQEDLVKLDHAIRRENERLEKAEKLHQTRDGFCERIAEHERRISKRELAQELLEGASRHLSQNFNRDLRDLVGKTLPMFTEGRYEHLQIGDDLTVRAFSSEKRDFMDFEEISSGTQRQIMLALRLALSQELVNGTAGGRQFVFLDEPFAFFDKERTRSALKQLPQLSDEICQIWVVAQDFPENQAFDLAITCDRSQVSLEGQKLTSVS
jgi:exonuclease SbcC